MIRALAVVALLLAGVAAAGAQTVTIPADTPATVLADHDGVDTQGYRLYVDGREVATRGRDELVNGRIAFQVPGFAHGAHTVAVAAFNADHEARSDTIAVTAQYRAPSAPVNVTITITVTVAPGEP